MKSSDSSARSSDEGHPEQDEQGGRVYEVLPRGKGQLELRFAQGAVQLAAVRKYQDRIQGQFAAMLLLSLGDREGMYRFMEKQPRAIFWPVAFYDEVRNEARFRALAAAQQMK